MKDNLLVLVALGLVVFAVGCATGNVIGESVGQLHVQQEAVLKGHAEWKPDDKGRPVFTWKESK